MNEGRPLVAPLDLAGTGNVGVRRASANLQGVLESVTEALNTQGRAIQSLIDCLETGVVLLGGGYRVLLANQAFRRMFGLQRGQPEGSTLEDVLPAVFTGQWSSRALLATRLFRDETAEVKDASTGRRYRTTLRRISSAGAGQSLIALLIEDRTGASGAQPPETSLQLFEKLLENSREAFLLVGPDGEILDASNAAAALFGSKREALQAALLSELTADGPTGLPQHRLDVCMRSKDWKLNGAAVETYFRRMDGTLFPANAAVTQWEQGRKRLALVSIQDLTELRSVELLARDRLDIVERIATNQPLDVTLASLAQMVEHHIPESRCAIMRRDGDLLSGLVAPNLPQPLFSRLQAVPIQSASMPAAEAVRDGKAASVPDLAAWAAGDGFREIALEHGFGACWSMPVFTPEGLAEATIDVYRKKPGEPSADQTELLKMAARFASVCIEQARLSSELAYRAHHDALTGLWNRAAFEDRMALGLANARRHGRFLAVLSIDLDHFKHVNDALGYTAGDLVLRETGRRMAAALRECDVLARWGGDEFVVGLLEVGERDDAWQVASKLVELVKQPVEVEGRFWASTATVGISVFPDDGEDLPSLLRNAERALRRAKQDGRSGLRFYAPELDAAQPRRLAAENELGRALDQEEFILHYQPQFDLRTGGVDSLEALLRWNHPQRGVIPPCEFLPAAEESGFIVPIGAWTLRAACRQIREWQESGRGRVRLAVNISAHQFTRQDLVQQVAAAIDEAGIDPRLLELELAEKLVAGDIDAAGPRIAELRKLGVRISLDDFGTGCTAVSNLQRLSVDCLKIDPSFVRRLGSSDAGAVLVESMIALAQSLGARATAEGVESEAELAALQIRGCDAVQGYLLAHPASADQLFPLRALPLSGGPPSLAV